MQQNTLPADYRSWLQFMADVYELIQKPVTKNGPPPKQLMVNNVIININEAKSAAFDELYRNLQNLVGNAKMQVKHCRNSDEGYSILKQMGKAIEDLLCKEF